MKCDELKSLKNIGLSFDTTTLHKQVIAEDSEGKCYGFDSWEEIYLKSDVDAAIAELKAELDEKDKDIAYWREEYDKETQLTDALKDEIESLKASHYAESVDAGMRERRLRRALWLARAERASDKANIFYFAMTCGIRLNIDGFSNKEKGRIRMRTAEFWRITWLKVERKCREKAEEYK